MSRPTGEHVQSPPASRAYRVTFSTPAFHTRLLPRRSPRCRVMTHGLRRAPPSRTRPLHAPTRCAPGLPGSVRVRPVIGSAQGRQGPERFSSLSLHVYPPSFARIVLLPAGPSFQSHHYCRLRTIQQEHPLRPAGHLPKARPFRTRPPALPPDMRCVRRARRGPARRRLCGRGVPPLLHPQRTLPTSSGALPRGAGLPQGARLPGAAIPVQRRAQPQGAHRWVCPRAGFQVLGGFWCVSGPPSRGFADRSRQKNFSLRGFFELSDERSSRKGLS